MSQQVRAYRKYSPTKLQAAVEAVRNGSMSKRKASMSFNVPRTTLIDKLSGKAPLGSNPGKPPVLTKGEESVLAEYCMLMADIAYPLTRHDLLQEVKKVLDLDGRKTPFKNNLPGKDWYYSFVRRHPEISERTPMGLGHHRAVINEQMIDQWFVTLFEFLKREVPDYQTMIKDPRRIFNADESGFPLCSNTGKVLASRGARHVYQVCTSNKTQITVMACINAIGSYVPPLIVYPGERFRDSGIHNFPEAIYGHTSNGWMDSSLFVEFLRHLLEFVHNESIPKPVLLFVDGSSTHMSYEAAKFCSENDIVLYCLLPNATHVLQACDVGLFSPMKKRWKQDVKAWQFQHLGQSLTKKHFPEVFRETWNKVAKLENAIHAFKRSGLYPLDPKNVDTSKLQPSKVQKYEDDHAYVRTQQENTVQIPDTTEVAVESSTISSATSHIHIEADEDVVDVVKAIPIMAEMAMSEESKIDKVSQPTHVTKPAHLVLKEVNFLRTEPSNKVSSAFHSLKVPEITTKRPVSNIRTKLPKAMSGTVALKMLKDREDAKRAEEEAKVKRKQERELKKKQREEEKENKRLKREELKRKREEKNRLKELMKMVKKKKTATDSSSESGEEPQTQDTSDEEFDEIKMCPGCGSNDGSQEEFIKCTACPRVWHLTCTGDAVLFEIPQEQLANYPFYCEFCQ